MNLLRKKALHFFYILDGTESRPKTAAILYRYHILPLYSAALKLDLAAYEGSVVLFFFISSPQTF